MAWVTNPGIRADAIISTIETNLTANGWTEVDGTPYFVYSAVNSQGVTQYVQITQSGTYVYIQLVGWRVWAAHAGSNGSSATYGRIYLGPAAIAAATLVDLYMSITANRIIIFIDSKTTNYRNWAYFGGLDTVIAGTSDPGCVLLLSSCEISDTWQAGQILLYQGGGSYYWCNEMFAGNTCGLFRNYDDFLVTSQGNLNQGLPFNGGKLLLYPILVSDSACYGTAVAAGIGPTQMRGMMDGLLHAPLGNGNKGLFTAGGMLAHLDTIVVGATTYLIIQPGGEIAVNTHSLTGNYMQGLAIAEV